MENCEQKPKYKGEIREAIIQNVKQNKNSYSLRKILVITDIEHKTYDEELSQTVSRKEWSIWSAINNILLCDEKSLSHINYFASIFLRERPKNQKKKSPQSSNE